MVEGDDPFAYPPVCFYKKESCTSRSAEDIRIVIFPLFPSFPLIYKAFYIKKSLKKFLKNFYKLKTNTTTSKPTQRFLLCCQKLLSLQGLFYLTNSTQHDDFCCVYSKMLVFKGFGVNMFVF